MSRDTAAKRDWRHVRPLRKKVGCLARDCKNNLHCFRKWRPRHQSYRNGTCVECGADLIDWGRLDKKNLKDIDYTFKSLNYEKVRKYFWDITIDKTAVNHAQKKGLEGLRVWAVNRLNRYVAAPSKELFRDGTQTPGNGRVVYYAQYATASCCRKCIEEWHGIDRNRPLTKREINYFTELIMSYIKRKLPDLPRLAEKRSPAIPVDRQM